MQAHPQLVENNVIWQVSALWWATTSDRELSSNNVGLCASQQCFIQIRIFVSARERERGRVSESNNKNSITGDCSGERVRGLQWVWVASTENTVNNIIISDEAATSAAAAAAAHWQWLLFVSASALVVTIIIDVVNEAQPHHQTRIIEKHNFTQSGHVNGGRVRHLHHRRQCSIGGSGRGQQSKW